jgi:hypothetical protein
LTSKMVAIEIVTCCWIVPLSLLMTCWTTMVNWLQVMCGVYASGIIGCSKTKCTYPST